MTDMNNLLVRFLDLIDGALAELDGNRVESFYLGLRLDLIEWIAVR